MGGATNKLTDLALEKYQTRKRSEKIIRWWRIVFGDQAERVEILAHGLPIRR